MVVAAGFDKAFKEGMRPERAALELRVELTSDKERVVFEFCDFDEPPVG